MSERQPTTDAVEILHRLYFEDKPEMLEMLEAERIKLDIAQQVCDLRQFTGLSQTEFAKQVGVNPSVIEDLEESDYDGDAFLMLNRIAKALNRKVEVRIIPLETQMAVA
jgi:ribosome-binding protein aMBF1 (putative translation factor)